MSYQGRPAVFLDRDGVLNRVVVRDGLPYPPQSLETFELYPDVPEGCRRLKRRGFLLIVVTNQPDVGRGTQSSAAVEAMHHQLASWLPDVDRIESCMHGGVHFGQDCDCRKPRPGMLLRAAHDLEIDLAASYLVGDRWRDVECARRAGCTAILIDRRYAEPLQSQPDFIVDSFGSAVDVVLGRTNCSKLLA